jgi:hypothetical protein
MIQDEHHEWGWEGTAKVGGEEAAADANAWSFWMVYALSPPRYL